MNSFVSKGFAFVLMQSAVIASLAFPLTAEARNCVKGKACGNSCISQKDVCHVGTAASNTTYRGSASGASTSAAEAVPAAAPAPIPAQNSPFTHPVPPATAPATATTQPATQPTAKVRHCSKGKACGNSCIPMKAVCHA